jgi:hypothetical protein
MCMVACGLELAFVDSDVCMIRYQAPMLYTHTATILKLLRLSKLQASVSCCEVGARRVLTVLFKSNLLSDLRVVEGPLYASWLVSVCSEEQTVVKSIGTELVCASYLLRRRVCLNE